jgi:SPP1 family predicted phage head-tail adaptor
MKAGGLNRKISIIEPGTPTNNALNEPVYLWPEKAKPWASVKGMGSKELYQAQKLFAETSVVFKVRYRTDIDATMRVVHESRTYEIVGTPIDPDGRRIELLILAKEVV